MPDVGGKKFDYSKKGRSDAKEYASRTGKTIRKKNAKPVRKKRGL